MMPGMTGAELAAEARVRAPGTRILIISGYAGLDQIPAGLRRLAKPFTVAQLGSELARAD